MHSKDTKIQIELSPETFARLEGRMLLQGETHDTAVSRLLDYAVGAEPPQRFYPPIPELALSPQTVERMKDYDRQSLESQAFQERLRGDKYAAAIIEEKVPTVKEIVPVTYGNPKPSKGAVFELESENNTQGMFNNMSPQAIERKKALDEFKAGMKRVTKAEADQLEKE